MGLGLLIFGVAGIAGANEFKDISIDAPYSFNDSQRSKEFSFNLDSDVLTIGDIETGDSIDVAELVISFIDNDNDNGANQEYSGLVYDGYSPYSSEDVATGDRTFNVTTYFSTSDHTLLVTITNKPFTLGAATKYGDFSFDTVYVHGCYTDNTPTQGVPEPTSLLLLGCGLVGLAATRLRKKH